MRMLITVVFTVFMLGCSSQSGKVGNVLPAPTGAKPAAAAELQKGNALFAAGDYTAAEHAFREAISADPAFAEAHYNLALTLDRAGQQGEAKQHYIQAANLAPGHKVIWDSPPLRQHGSGLNHDIDKKSYLDPNPRGN